MNQDLLLQEAIFQAIKTGTPLRLEADGNKVIRMEPDSAYDLNKEIIKIQGSAEIIYLGGVSLKRSITHQEVKKIAVWANLDFKVVKMLCGEEIPHRIEEAFTIKQSNLSKEELETPPFLRN